MGADLSGTNNPLQQLNTGITDLGRQFTNGGFENFVKQAVSDYGEFWAEGFREIFGENKKRKARFESEDALKQEEKIRKQQVADAQLQAERIDTQASQAAAAVKATGRQITNQQIGVPQPGNLLGERDFLGL